MLSQQDYDLRLIVKTSLVQSIHIQCPGSSFCSVKLQLMGSEPGRISELFGAKNEIQSMSWNVTRDTWVTSWCHCDTQPSSPSLCLILLSHHFMHSTPSSQSHTRATQIHVHSMNHTHSHIHTTRMPSQRFTLTTPTHTHHIQVHMHRYRHSAHLHKCTHHTYMLQVLFSLSLHHFQRKPR